MGCDDETIPILPVVVVVVVFGVLALRGDSFGIEHMVNNYLNQEVYLLT